MIRGAIFDFDGTLFDSMSVWENVGADYLRSVDIIPEENLSDVLCTMSMEQAAQYMKEHYDLPFSRDEICKSVLRMIENAYFYDVQPKKGVRSLLEALKQRDVKMCIASATPVYLIEAALKRCDLADYFMEILSCSDFDCGKDEPTIFLKALGVMETAKNETLVFEDALHVLRSAKREGFLTVGVYDSSEKHSEEIKNTADLYVEDLTNNKKIIDFADRVYHKDKGKNMKTALTIAGSDCSGGAGIQADIKTMTMNGVYAMSAVTALTAQNTTGVSAISESSADFLAAQLNMIFEDIRPDAVKTGMVASPALIEVIAEKLSAYKAENIIVDPVMIATSGSKLLADEAITVLKDKLIPIASLVTPNTPEGEVLAGMTIKNREDMIEAAKIINEETGCAVLLKGGHLINEKDEAEKAADLLYDNGRATWFESERIDNPNTHGTGCTLSSAIAANLAKGFSLEEAIRRAKEYVSGALSAMLDLGRGSGPMNHAFDLGGKFAEAQE